MPFVNCCCSAPPPPCDLLPFFLPEIFFGLNIVLSLPQRKVTTTVTADRVQTFPSGLFRSGIATSVAILSAVDGSFQYGDIVGTLTVEITTNYTYEQYDSGTDTYTPYTPSSTPGDPDFEPPNGTATYSANSIVSASEGLYSATAQIQAAYAYAWAALTSSDGTPADFPARCAAAQALLAAGPTSLGRDSSGQTIGISVIPGDPKAYWDAGHTEPVLAPTGFFAPAWNKFSSKFTMSADEVVSPYPPGDAFVSDGAPAASGFATVFPFGPGSSVTGPAVYATFRPIGSLDATHDFTRFFFVSPTEPSHHADAIENEYTPGTSARLNDLSVYVVESCTQPFDCFSDFDYSGYVLPPTLGFQALAASIFMLQEDVDNLSNWCSAVDPSQGSNNPFYPALPARLGTIRGLALGDKVRVGGNSNSPPTCGTIAYAEPTKDQVASDPYKVIKMGASDHFCDSVIATPCNPNWPSVWFKTPIVTTTTQTTVTTVGYGYATVVTTVTVASTPPTTTTTTTSVYGYHSVVGTTTTSASAPMTMPTPDVNGVSAFWNIPGTESNGGPHFALSNYITDRPTDTTTVLSGGAQESVSFCAQAKVITGTPCSSSVAPMDFWWWSNPSNPDAPTGTYFGDNGEGCLTLGAPFDYAGAGPYPTHSVSDLIASPRLDDCAACPLYKIVITACDSSTTELYAMSAPPALNSRWKISNTSISPAVDASGKITTVDPTGGDPSMPRWDDPNLIKTPAPSDSFTVAVDNCDGSGASSLRTEAAQSVGSFLRWDNGSGKVTASTHDACPADEVTDVTAVSYCPVAYPPLKVTTTSAATGTTSIYWIDTPLNWEPYPASIPMAGQWWRTDLYDPPFSWDGTAMTRGGSVPFVEQIQTVEIQADGTTIPPNARMWADPVVVLPINITLDTAGIAAVAQARTSFDDVFAKRDALLSAQAQLAADTAAGAPPPVIAADTAAVAAAQLAYDAAKEKYVADESDAVSATSAQSATGGLIKVTCNSADGRDGGLNFFTDPIAGDHVPAVGDVYTHPLLKNNWDWPIAVMDTPPAFSVFFSTASSINRLYTADPMPTLAGHLWSKIRSWNQWAWDGASAGFGQPAQVQELDDSLVLTVTAVSALGGGVNTDPRWEPIAGPYPTIDAAPYARVVVAGAGGSSLEQTEFFLDTTQDAIPELGHVYKRASDDSANTGRFTPAGKVVSVDLGMGRKGTPSWSESLVLDQMFLSEGEACAPCFEGNRCLNMSIGLVAEWPCDGSVPRPDPIYYGNISSPGDFYADAATTPLPKIGDRYTLPATSFTGLVTYRVFGTVRGNTISPTVVPSIPPAPYSAARVPGIRPQISAIYALVDVVWDGDARYDPTLGFVRDWSGNMTETTTLTYLSVPIIVTSVLYSTGKPSSPGMAVSNTTLPFQSNRTTSETIIRIATDGNDRAVGDYGIAVFPALSAATKLASHFTVTATYLDDNTITSTFDCAGTTPKVGDYFDLSANGSNPAGDVIVTSVAYGYSFVSTGTCQTVSLDWITYATPSVNGGNYDAAL